MIAQPRLEAGGEDQFLQALDQLRRGGLGAERRYGRIKDRSQFGIRRATLRLNTRPRFDDAREKCRTTPSITAAPA
jgi:hypothetical protein